MEGVSPTTGSLTAGPSQGTSLPLDVDASSNLWLWIGVLVFTIPSDVTKTSCSHEYTSGCGDMMVPSTATRVPLAALTASAMLFSVVDPKIQ
eukprot:CAMPEP_0170179980 /NCGR_PEP_ID=MMETSP0040_2-20121228/20077_1 /TAXON_ID=641309 /ORGANISM="Lotharella oceanica, Strain CCMP622" /LENGTH=91 /DNA_ID=CAMNT_0010424405 /DNA_START=15 /DNA_END=290 /DNA_ORIENTATION=-